MRFPAITLLVTLVTGAAGASAPATLHAQGAMAVHLPASHARRLELLSRERVQHWAATAPKLRCAPAPLTERPTASAEYSRPRVAPLEAAFFDGVTVKRTFAARDGGRSN